MATGNPAMIVAVFTPHGSPDRWSLASRWLRPSAGRTFEVAKGEWDVAFTASPMR